MEIEEKTQSNDYHPSESYHEEEPSAEEDGLEEDLKLKVYKKRH